MDIPEGFDGRLFFQQNLSMTRDDQRTGMRIAVYRNSEWQWENITDEPSTLVIDIGGSLDIIDSIVLMFYSTGFESDEKVEYKVTSCTADKASGIIEINWEKTFNASSDDESRKETLTTIITEDIVKVTSDVGNATDETLSYFSMGERYLIKNMDITQTYHSVHIKGREQEKVTGAGSYQYQGNTDYDGSIPELPGMPDLSGLNELIKTIPSIEELEEMLGSTDGFEDIRDSIPSLPDIDTGGEGEFIPELPELPQSIELPSFGLNTGGSTLSRIVISPDIGSFEFYPVLPPEAETEKWMSYEFEHTYPDPKNEGSLKTDKATSQDTPYQMLPLWFMNPDFKEEDADEFQMTPEEAQNIQDTQELTGILSQMQANFNKLNIQKLISNPQTGFEIDFSDTIDPVPVSAVLVEKAMFNHKTFTAELTAKTITQKGNTIHIKITVNYDFK